MDYDQCLSCPPEEIDIRYLLNADKKQCHVVAKALYEAHPEKFSLLVAGGVVAFVLTFGGGLAAYRTRAEQLRKDAENAVDFPDDEEEDVGGTKEENE